jgi:hypothetical protein
MSMIRPMAWLAALIAALGAAGYASAQVPVPNTAPGSDAFWQFQPFVDFGAFEHDFQFFAPAEVNDFGGEEKPHTGFYVTFDRTNVAVTRPIDRFSFGSENRTDFTWGNRMELGYMKGDPSGWQGVLWHVNGPNERTNNSEFIEQFQNSDASAIQQFVVPGDHESINELKMSSFELNKVFRLKPYHNGTILEPLLGYRYINLRDYFQRETFQEVNVPTNIEFFQRDTHRAQFMNSMHGGQLGARLFRQRGRWLLSADVKMFALANFQSLRVVNQQSFLPNPELELVDQNFVDVIAPFVVGTQFCFGGEVRCEASYELTRDINLRVGGVFLDLGQGIGRGDLIRINNQAVQMAGVTFGFTVNR